MPVPEFGQQGPPQKKSMTPWLVGAGGAALALVLVIVAAVYLINNNDTGRPAASESTAPPASSAPADPSPEPTTAESTPAATPEATSPPNGEFPQPAGGRITDTATGLSYAFPGDPWTVASADQLNPQDPNAQHWTSGYFAESQKDFEPGKDWTGSVYAGPLANGMPYDGPKSLKNTLGTFFVNFESAAYEPPHGRRILDSRAIKVNGRSAWLLKFEMDFSEQSGINHWNWKKERGALVLVDRGADQRPSLLWATIPDNLDNTVLDKVLKSLQAS